MKITINVFFLFSLHTSLEIYLLILFVEQKVKLFSSQYGFFTAGSWTFHRKALTMMMMMRMKKNQSDIFSTTILRTFTLANLSYLEKREKNWINYNVWRQLVRARISKWDNSKCSGAEKSTRVCLSEKNIINNTYICNYLINLTKHYIFNCQGI